jgi:hypothetical protein
LPAKLTAGLARGRVSGKSLVPRPPPRITAVTSFTVALRLFAVHRDLNAPGIIFHHRERAFTEMTQ